MTTVLPRFEGGRRELAVSLGVGVLGLAATLAGGFLSPRDAAYGYLFAFAYWLSLCLGALLILAAFHASRSRWSVVLRRPLEVMAACCPLFILLFIPVGLTMRQLFPWVDPSPSLGEHALHLLEHKRPYLNVPGFLLRAAVYFGVWCAVALLLYRWSVRQDAEPEQSEHRARITRWQRRLSAGSLPVLVLCLSFASLDWLMSLEPFWESTVYALFVGCGAVMGALSVVGLLAARGQAAGQFGALMRSVHFRWLGTLLLSFICLWAYCVFSQFLLIWIATLPDEVQWYRARLDGGWRWVAALLALGHFAVPFLLLLQRRIKEHPRALAAVCGWMLLMHAVDMYWLVLPALHPREWYPHWTSLTAWLGVGGVSVAAGLWVMRGGYTVPVRDPFLPHSLQVPSHE